MSGNERKIDGECRVVYKEWTSKSLLTETKGEAVRLVCGEQIAVCKDYNVNRHYETKHAQKYKNLAEAERARASEDLLSKLQRQKGLFTKLHASRDAAIRTSFGISHKIARNSKPFSDGEFGKECLVDSVAIICPEKKEAFSNVPLSSLSVITDGCPNMTGKNVGFLKQMQDKVNEINPEQKLIFLHCIIHQEVLCKSVLQISHVVDVVTKIVNFIRARALNHRQFVSLLEEPESDHGDRGYHTAVRWLSLGKVLKRVWDLRAEIQTFCQMKGKDIPEFSDKHWIADLASAIDVTTLMNELNTKRRGKGLSAHEMFSLVTAFMRKLKFLSSQLKINLLTHMPTLKAVTPSADHLDKYSSMFAASHDEFSRRFEDFKAVESEMPMISSPVTCCPQ
ncbi:general transcription factor II-I repeat domain-containing protein 2-like [Ranitomeya variabilis]|uniref:general transcription factor II-I repeat domain-containing protein 2-like n=1 Tax=Ranitomeya variabilis TaxID=490064 RepID=UPI00405734C6